MEKVDTLIIGAGVIGLAIGNELSQYRDDVVIVEQEDSFGRHTSSRNSEVIHSGIYYPENSLKAELCVEGNRLLYQFCKNHDIPFKKTGKLVVANNTEEQKFLDWLLENGKKNGVEKIKLLSAKEIIQLEPEIIANKALFVEDTGIFDTHTFMKKLEDEIENNDGFIVYGMEVVKIEQTTNCFIVYFKNGEIWETKWLINSAGIFCENIAKMLGLETIKEKLQIYYCKGEYYKLSKPAKLNHLIYPVPDSSGTFLGIHLTLNLNNEIRFGPNAYYVDDISYQFEQQYKSEFLKAINSYFPVTAEDIHPDDCGIRPKLQGKNQDFRDFYIEEESKHKIPRFINLMGIESPGLTASLAIAKRVKRMQKCD